MRIAVKLAEREDLHPERLDELTDQRGAVHGDTPARLHRGGRFGGESGRGRRPGRGESSLDDRPEAFALHKRHRHHPRRAELGNRLRGLNVGNLAVDGVADEREHLRLAFEVELERHLRAVLLQDRGVIEG